MTKINLTDQELNEWVAINICKWPYNKFVYVVVNGITYNVPTWIMEGFTPENPHSGCYPGFKPYDYCNDLNHTHLMEEKIREVGALPAYLASLYELLELHFYNTTFIFDVQEKADQWFKFIHASARQRCEAAYLAFSNSEGDEK